MGTNRFNYEKWKREVGVDVTAALVADGWTDLQVVEKSVNGVKTFVHEGKPPKGGPVRPVVKYSRDVCRALHLVRKSVRSTDAEVVISITPTRVYVDAYPRDEDSDEELFHGEGDRTDLLAILLTQCAIKLAELSSPSGLTGRDSQQKG